MDASKVKGGKQADYKKISWRDEVGVFFDSAERHDNQYLADTRAGESAWVANFLPDANRGGGGVDYG